MSEPAEPPAGLPGEPAPSFMDRYALAQRARRRARARADGADRVPRGRDRRVGHDRQEPAAHLPGDLRRLRPELAVSVDLLGRALARGAQPAADAADHDAAHPHRPRRCLRVPLRDVQHRRAGPVPRRLDLRRLDRILVRRDELDAAHRPRNLDRSARRRGVGRDCGPAESDRRCARGDHDDHAELGRDLGGAVPVRGRRPAAERHAVVRPDLERRRSTARS